MIRGFAVICLDFIIITVFYKQKIDRFPGNNPHTTENPGNDVKPSFSGVIRAGKGT